MKLDPPVHPRFLQASIQITQPALGASGPLPCPISDPNGCKISASGSVVDIHATIITKVRGWVNDESFAQAGTFSSLDWSIGGVGKAICGHTNTFTVEVTYTKDDATSTTESASRDFVATGHSGSCSGTFLVGQQRPLARLMPRYYKLRVDVDSLPLSLRDERLLPVGPLGNAPVYLAYDLALSTPAEPVWRDINLPSSAGHWTLRVRASSCGLTAELVLQRLTERAVLPPLIFYCLSWKFSSPNVLVPAAHSSVSKVPGLVLVAEPA